MNRTLALHGARHHEGGARGDPRNRTGGRVIIDSSAVIPVLLREPGHGPVLDRLLEGDRIRIGAPTLVETSMVLVSRVGIVGKTLLARLLEESATEIVEFTADHWPVALDAFSRSGKGRHPAALNFGDCLTYAVTKRCDEPLLCVGEDFRQTDLLLVEVREGADEYPIAPQERSAPNRGIQ